MNCPYCQTDNRDDRETCYYCNKDLSMLRLIVNKAKHHYNQALELAERGHLDDAIVELKNALDLDGSMIGAHVVLGTIYAKKEMFAEARQSWQQALAQNHHLEKAHDYLFKAEKAEYIFPAMKRARRMVYVMGGATGGLLLLLIILGIALWRPDRDMQAVQESVALLRDDDHNTGEAVRKLGAVLEKKDASHQVRQLAGGLHRTLNREWQERLTLASQALSNNSPYAALIITDSVRQENPDSAVLASIGRQRIDASQRLIHQMHDSADRFNAGKMPFEEFRDETQRFMNFTQTGSYHDAAADMLKKATAVHRERLLAEATEALTTAPIAKAVVQSVNWKAQDSALADALRKLLDQRLTAETARVKSQVSQLITAGQGDEARLKLEELALLYQTAQVTAPTQMIAQLQGRIAAAERQKALDAVEAAYQGKQWEQFLALSVKPASLTDDKADQQRLETMRGEARKAFASETWDWFQARDNAFESGTIPPADAARAIKTYGVAMPDLPASLAYARAPMLVYAAASHWRLGQVDHARELIRRAEKEYPKSYAIKTAKALARRIDAATAPKAPKSAAQLPTLSAPAAKDAPGKANVAHPIAVTPQASAKPHQATKPQPAATPAAKPAGTKPRRKRRAARTAAAANAKVTAPAAAAAAPKSAAPQNQ